MSNPTDTQALHAALMVEMSGTKPGSSKKATPESKARLRAILADLESKAQVDAQSKAHSKAVSNDGADSVKFHRDYQKYGEPSGLTLAEFADVWKLRQKVVMYYNRQGREVFKSAYSLWKDATRQRLKRPPRKNADLSGMNADEKRLHRRPQNAKSQRKLRAEKRAHEELRAGAARLLTDDELLYIAEAEAAPKEVDQYLASLGAAEAAE
ncbi:hypothetical protein [Pseudogemmobacter faecipullorum]|uniref:Uncharacterized protein n=1 Tax=Pseudogemmobacter faecipullorum TaxID=2755041 RepID=A0ABS8CR77_9RHOB|nr:hypothetical protein [Pseudogemmobacter faecipullorum]MCB5411889.1 hypothetical protein [Pseudogemmobacter faecipullorum]